MAGVDLICKIDHTKTVNISGTGSTQNAPNLDILNKSHKIKELEEAILKKNARISKLESDLARKYRHVHKLKERITMLETILSDDFIDPIDEFAWLPPLISHSGKTPPGQAVMEGNASLTQKITAFADEDAGWTNEIGSSYDATMDLANNNDGALGQFLERPIRADVNEWLVNQPLFYKVNPWKLFCENEFVRDKIQNYELLRMKLHARFVISGTQFHYGRAIVGYNPLSGFDEVTVSRAFLDVDIVQLSQKPHVFLNPTKNTGGTIDMPFMWPKNYLSLSDGDYDEMGELTIKSFGNLQHANSGDDTVTVTMYLWATDVVLTMPTSIQPPAVTLQSQAGTQINAPDEYGSGIISKPAAMIEKAAGVLETLPVIGPYALATQMIASKVGQVAKIFGYSRPSILDPPKPFKPNPTGNLANADAPDAVQKLTLDSKAEVTVDTRVVGLDGRDQMGIKDIAMRESYLTSFAFSTGDAVDDMLWNVGVSPNLYAVNSTEIHPTPMAMIANSFENWQGSMKFRFQVVKSNFHKGKILVRYDPNSNSAGVNYNTNYSRVVDIAEDEDFEVVVGWAQAKAWLNCARMTTTENFSDTVRLPTTTGIRNGVLEINVINRLVSPAQDKDISINVFVSMCDDVKFSEPTNAAYQELQVFPEVVPVPATIDPVKRQILKSQSGMETVAVEQTDCPTGAETCALDVIGGEAAAADHTYEVFYGDPPTTLRELCKRYTFQRVWIPARPIAGTFRTNNLVNKDFPYQTGWDPNGIDLSEVDGTTPLTVTQKGPIAWFSPCYAAYRGALRRKYNFTGATDTTASVTRRPYTNQQPGFVYNSQTTSDDEEFLSKAVTKACHKFSMRGSSSTNNSINNTIEIEVPYYSQDRLSSTRLLAANELQSNTHDVCTFSYGGEASGPAIQDAATTTTFEWVAAGEDFTFMFWTGAPILYEYNVGPTS